MVIMQSNGCSSKVFRKPKPESGYNRTAAPSLRMPAMCYVDHSIQSHTRHSVVFTGNAQNAVERRSHRRLRSIGSR